MLPVVVCAAPERDGECYLSFSCTEPNAYLQFVGRGFPHDKAGDRNNRVRAGHEKDGFPWWMYNGITLSKTPTCGVSSAPAQVSFAQISAQQLQRHQTRQATFRIVLECDSGAVSGAVEEQAVIGLQVSPYAFLAA